ncbi:centrosomal protein of 290 kDa isoform X2 [Leptopilina heterotoma]|uniref:centrosomal protein of 290 kDa isoform X2 n=1 Tax=Leptopilina heterotoma TaxID=63436 RepID=UPI001CA8CED7|nr:centrosomal protein of 290 kDa isoform X2 [Leptopilina heterotoma]
MVAVDWDRVLSINPQSLKDEEIEDLYPMVVECDAEEINNIHNLQVLFKISQEILQIKDSQIESLLIECDEYREKILMEKETPSRKQKSGRKLEATDESGIDSQRDSGYEENVQEMLREKNSKIETLMQELEGFEQENTILKENLTILKEEMEDATEKMNEMTDKLTSLQENINIYKEKSGQLECENKALVIQIEEMAAQQVERDKLIDDFGLAIDARIIEWKSILDEKDVEIAQLKENLSQTRMQTPTTHKSKKSSKIESLSEEIDHRDKIILELQTKLSEAVTEINESCSVIEKLKTDSQSTEGSRKKRDQRDLIKKYQSANERIENLQKLLDSAENDASVKSKELCEALVIIQKYENHDQGLTDTLNELKEVKDQLNYKNQYIQDIVNVINKLEMINSHQEAEIIALREKLGMPEEEEIAVDHIIKRRQEEKKKFQESEQMNKMLKDENLELKSEIRTLRYKLKKLATKIVGQTSSPLKFDTIDNPAGSSQTLAKLDENWFTEREKDFLSDKIEIKRIKDDVQFFVEENSALRKGMHEILDSIRNQDGKSAVQIQSETLERLLEALDIRHLAGWYHPAMRMQEQLNVIQGINSELRTQNRELRNEAKRKDLMLQQVGFQSPREATNVEDTESEKTKINVSEMEELQEAYQNEIEEWQKQTDLLKQEKSDQEELIIKLELKVQEYENNWKLLNLPDDDVRSALDAKTKEYIEMAGELSLTNRKCTILQEHLSKESTKLYLAQKEAIAKESCLQRHLADSEKRIKNSENHISTLQSNLLNSVSVLQYNELNEKYVEANMKLRAAVEDRLLQRAKLETKLEEIQTSEKMDIVVMENSTQEIKIKLLEEQQRAERLSQLYDKSRKQLTQIEIDLARATASNSELRDQLIQLHQTLTNEMKLQNTQQPDVEELLRDYNKRINNLQVENKNLKQMNDISKEEAQMQYAVNSLKTIELDSLRHQILDLQAISEDKETIARLGFELMNCRSLETELRKRKEVLDNNLLDLNREIEEARKSNEDIRKQLQHYREQSKNRCQSYGEIVRFLQQQYAGSTSLTALERYEKNLEKLIADREECQKMTREAKEESEKVNIQQEILSNRLQIVEQLKDILEQQIGSPDVQTLMQRFSEESQRFLSDLKYKRQISHLEYELETANKKLLEYESTVTSMEFEMLNMQKVWKDRANGEKATNEKTNNESPQEIPEVEVDITFEEPAKRTDDENLKSKNHLKENVETKEVVTTSTQTDSVAKRSIDLQCELKIPSPESEVAKQILDFSSDSNKQIEKDEKIHIFHKEQLNKALALASERSAIISRLESQITEFQTKIKSLMLSNEEKDVKISERDKIIELGKNESNIPSTARSDEALNSTINTLQKLITQKEETIARYQLQLKEDRNEHGKVASILQEEIKHLQEKVAIYEKEDNSRQMYEVPERDDKPEKEDSVKENLSKDYDSIVDSARLQERILMLEADLKAARELGQRWHRLAEDRLGHSDAMRSRLEEQHKTELESYRLELHKWQSETISLRKQFSENRMKLAKENISISKDLHEKENQIQDLSVTCQQLQNELEVMETVVNVPQTNTYDVREAKICETIHNSSREQAINQSQTQLDCLRRQLQALLDKERIYKNQIAELKQQQSRRYMATKTQEKKNLQREVQLDRKVKSLEEELQRTKEQLNRESLVHEVKKAKTAEELALWEKQKKWQQMAEKLKEKLKEKTDEVQKLQTNHEKLRSIISCMEREKYYLRSKLKLEKSGMSAGFEFSPSVSAVESNIVEDLEKECNFLKNRNQELAEKLANNECDQLRCIIEEQKRRLFALETVAAGNTYVINQLEKLEGIKNTLEKENLRLETENFQLRIEVEKLNLDTPGLREKIEHLEKYVQILKEEKISDSSEKLHEGSSSKKTVHELEKTLCVLKRIIEKLQGENKRLKSKNSHRLSQQVKTTSKGDESSLRKQYELSKQQIVSLETDLQLSEQRIIMLENSLHFSDDSNGEIKELKLQIAHKSELLDKVKHLLTRAAINEKALRQKIQQLEMRQTLSTIPECCMTPTNTN